MLDQTIIPYNHPAYAVEDYQVIGMIKAQPILAGVQIQGRRSEQQDRMFSAILEKADEEIFRSLSLVDFDKIFTETFKEINKKMLEAFPEQGSTAIVAIIDPKKNKTVFANIGDSELIEVRKSQNGKWEAKTCNTLHRPDDGRINDKLVVSRSLGDKEYIEHGLIATPDVVCLEDCPELFIITSDGLKDGGLTNEEIAFHMNRWQDKSLHEKALALAEVVKSVSKDNISFKILECPEELEKVVVVGMFDGHGGKDISAYCQENFLGIFLNKMRLAYMAQPSALIFSGMSSSSSSSSSSPPVFMSTEGRPLNKSKIT